MQPTLEEITASPEWHLQRFDPEGERFLLVQLDEQLLRDASFLDERIEPEVRAGFWFEQRRLGEVFDPCESAPGQPALIFHTGHCGSTLLSRGLATDPCVLPLREPLTLRQLADSLRMGVPREHWEPVARAVLSALGRTFRPGQRPLVKATSTCNNLIAPLLLQDPDRHAVLMHVSLSAHLANMLGRAHPMTDLRGFLGQRMADWAAMAGKPPADFDEHNDVQLAVLAWLTGMYSLIGAHREHPNRTQLLDFDQFLGSAEATLVELSDFLRLGAEPEQLVRGWPQVAGGYSKQPDAPFNAAARRDRLSRGRSQRANAFQEGMRWAELQVAETPSLSACADYFN